MKSNKIYKLSNIIVDKIAGAAEKNSIQFLQNILKNTAFEKITYVSGGYVRDYVKGIQSNDLDLVVQANGGSKQLSDYLLNILDGYVTYQKLHPYYPTYNLLFKDNVQINNKLYELKGADIDISDTAKIRYAQDSGKSKEQLFVYGNLEDDANQRDFTMNALFMDLINQTILDPTNYGCDDIKNNLLRLIPQGNKQSKLYNNPKVLLRYCRFYAKYQMNVIQDDIDLLKKFSFRITSLQNDQVIKQIEKIPAESMQYAKKMMQKIDIFDYLKNYLF